METLKYYLTVLVLAGTIGYVGYHILGNFGLATRTPMVLFVALTVGVSIVAARFILARWKRRTDSGTL